MGIQVRGIKGSWYVIGSNVKVRCNLTYVEDDNTAYWCDFVVRDEAKNQYIIDARIDSEFFQKWHKMPYQKPEMNELLNKACMEYLMDTKQA